MPAFIGNAVRNASLVLALMPCLGALAEPGAKGDDKAANPDKVTVKLEMDARKLDFAGTKAENLMYMPSSAKLSSEKPKSITKEPTYVGTPKYATITLGNGSHTQFVIAFDEPEGKPAKVYPDLNGNGDLTDDKVSGAWDKITENADSGAQFDGTYTFQVTWKNADGKETSGQYALNFYRGAGRDSVNYYRASARTGKITLQGKEYAVMLIENDNDALFDKLSDPNKPQVVGEAPTKPVWLSLDGDRYDIRGTFGFADMNYLATVSQDGSQLTVGPTMKVIKLPRAGEKLKMLGTGGEAPDFEAEMFKADLAAGAPAPRFKLSDFRNKKVVVLDMWATWCGPCMRGLPHINRLAESAKGQDVIFIALNSFDDAPAYDKFAHGKGKDFACSLARDPAGREGDASIAKRLYSVTGIPATYVIDKSGKIVAAISGYEEGDKQLQQALKGLGIKTE